MRGSEPLVPRVSKVLSQSRHRFRERDLTTTCKQCGQERNQCRLSYERRRVSCEPTGALNAATCSPRWPSQRPFHIREGIGPEVVVSSQPATLCPAPQKRLKIRRLRELQSSDGRSFKLEELDPGRGAQLFSPVRWRSVSNALTWSASRAIWCTLGHELLGVRGSRARLPGCCGCGRGAPRESCLILATGGGVDRDFS